MSDSSRFPSLKEGDVLMTNCKPLDASTWTENDGIWWRVVTEDDLKTEEETDE